MLLDETAQAIKAAINEGFSMVADAIEDSESEENAVVYGFHIDSTESDPGKAVTYLEDAAGMTPARMNYLNDKFSYGSWIDAFFFPRPCMVRYDGTVDYYLDPDDYEKKENGELSALGDSTLEYGVKYPGNAMMEWGRDGYKIWTKVVPDEEDVYSGSVYISNKKIDDDYTAWPFVNNQGNMVSHFYTAIYNGSMTAYTYDSSTYYRLRSIPRRPVMNSPGNNSYDIPWDDDTEATPTTWSSLTQAGHEVRFALNNNTALNYTTSADFPTLSTNRNSIYWFTEVFCDIQLINNLLVLIGKSLNTQDVFGNGNMSGNGTTGYINNGVLFTGSDSYDSSGTPQYNILNKAGLFWGSSGSKYAVKTFGMENWWGNQYRRYAGHISKSSSITSDYDHFIKNTFGTEDGSTTIGYNTSGSGYIDTQVTIPASNNYITKSKFVNTITHSGVTYKIGTFLASVTASSGSGSTFYSDYFYQNRSGTCYAARGGGSGGGGQCGAFYVSANAAFSYANWALGAALSFKPAA